MELLEASDSALSILEVEPNEAFHARTALQQVIMADVHCCTPRAHTLLQQVILAVKLGIRTLSLHQLASET